MDSFEEIILKSNYEKHKVLIVYLPVIFVSSDFISCLKIIKVEVNSQSFKLRMLMEISVHDNFFFSVFVGNL